MQFGNLSAGAHKLEIKNLTGVVYVDRFCLTNSSSNAQPATGPGNTTNQSSSVSAGQTSSSNYQMQSGSQEISVVAESSVNVPFKLALVNPSGLTLQTVDASNGTAVLNASVTQSGIYVIKVINVSLGPLQFTTTVTPLVATSLVSQMSNGPREGTPQGGLSTPLSDVLFEVFGRVLASCV